MVESLCLPAIVCGVRETKGIHNNNQAQSGKPLPTSHHKLSHILEFNWNILFAGFLDFIVTELLVGNERSRESWGNKFGRDKGICGKFN